MTPELTRPSRRLPHVGIVLVAVTFLAPLAPVRLSAGEEGRQALGFSRRILTEEQRQQVAGRRVDHVVRSFSDLVKDLRSNGLLDKGQGGELLELARELDAVNVSHVQKAVAHLRTARQQLVKPVPHLTAADGEIVNVIDRLKELLKRVKALEATELLRREVKELIKEEELLHAESKAVGKELYEGEVDIAPKLEDLGRSQERTATRAAELREPMREATEGTEDPNEKRRVEEAARLFEEKAVDKRLTSALRHLEAQEMIAAVLDQKEAIDALREIDRLLDPDSDRRLLEDTREQLVEILKEQRDLRDLVEQAPEDAFRTAQPDLQVEQREIAGKMQQVDQNLFEPTPGASPPESAPDATSPPSEASPSEASPSESAEGAPEGNPVAEAQAAMAEAEGALAQGQQQPAAGSQKQAEVAIERAISELDRRLAEEMGADAQLAEQMSDLQSTIDDIRDLENAQRELKETTEAQTNQGQSVAPQSTPQEALAGRTEDVAQSTPVPSIQQPLGDAQQAMQQAAGQLQQNEGIPAAVSQERALDALAEARQAAEGILGQLEEAAAMAQQMAAVQSLIDQQQQLMQDTQQAGPSALPSLSPPQAGLAAEAQSFGQMPMAGPAIQQAAQHMEAAAQSLGEQAQEAALGQQQEALSALASAMGQMGQAMEPGMEQGMGQGMGLGMRMSISSSGMALAGSQPGFDPQGGDRGFVKEAPGGEKVERDRATWSSLGGRRHSALNEKFIARLPIEYRSMLKAYFEALAKEGR